MPGKPPTPWSLRDMTGAYRELEHPADLLIEVRGAKLAFLMEHALFALYDQTAELEDVRATESRRLCARGPTPADALRRLLAEALYLFATEGFLGAAAEVEVSGFARGPGTPASPDEGGSIDATVWGEPIDRGRHHLLAEIKAVTYHRLEVHREAHRWTATVLLDV
jgi:SHS2 domain-containing protein